LTATLADGSALPDWLTFNPATRTFEGTPPLNFYGAIEIKVTASGWRAEPPPNVFKLAVTPVNDAPVIHTPDGGIHYLGLQHHRQRHARSTTSASTTSTPATRRCMSSSA